MLCLVMGGRNSKICTCQVASMASLVSKKSGCLFIRSGSDCVVTSCLASGRGKRGVFVTRASHLLSLCWGWIAVAVLSAEQESSLLRSVSEGCYLFL